MIGCLDFGLFFGFLIFLVILGTLGLWDFGTLVFCCFGFCFLDCLDLLGLGPRVATGGHGGQLAIPARPGRP